MVTAVRSGHVSMAHPQTLDDIIQIALVSATGGGFTAWLVFKSWMDWKGAKQNVQVLTDGQLKTFAGTLLAGSQAMISNLETIIMDNEARSNAKIVELTAMVETQTERADTAERNLASQTALVKTVESLKLKLDEKDAIIQELTARADVGGGMLLRRENEDSGGAVADGLARIIGAQVKDSINRGGGMPRDGV